MSKILLLAASAAVALGSVVTASDANARYLWAPRAFYGYHGYGPGYYGYYGYGPGYYAPRSFYGSPMYAPNAPAPRNFYNPGIPDFQLGAR
jgi:opacity protein-like surface antigen